MFFLSRSASFVTVAPRLCPHAHLLFPLKSPRSERAGSRGGFYYAVRQHVAQAWVCCLSFSLPPRARSRSGLLVRRALEGPLRHLHLGQRPLHLLNRFSAGSLLAPRPARPLGSPPRAGLRPRVSHLRRLPLILFSVHPGRLVHEPPLLLRTLVGATPFLPLRSLVPPPPLSSLTGPGSILIVLL